MRSGHYGVRMFHPSIFVQQCMCKLGLQSSILILRLKKEKVPEHARYKKRQNGKHQGISCYI